MEKELYKNGDEMMEVEEFLRNNQDKKYQEFSENLNICKGIRSIGVRIPIIRKYAKELTKKYSIDYLINNIPDDYYEEILLKGFIIGNYPNLTYEELIYYIDNHLPKVIDWSMCDTFVASLKITKKYLHKLWDYINTKLKSKKEFEVRFGLVMILNYYINPDYKDKIYEVIESVNLDEFYVKMANAWLLSYMFINYFDDTINFINHNKIDKWTLRKGISKAIESYQVSDDNKKILKVIRKGI